MIQLALHLVCAPTVVERIAVGHFQAHLWSNGSWWLTFVEAERPGYGKTPKQWFTSQLPTEFPLLHFDPSKKFISKIQREYEEAAKPVELKSVATRWLRCFNESFQLWRMGSWS
jgi:hypothetical protein